MPGILPMKVIKVGSSTQTRIAQACDRCRSKKIRCDGLAPTCTQCKSVGFECKTSDKLSRRAFPRGYTESLEDRVRALELEVRELKDLLDEKDEKIEMLSKFHSQSSMMVRKTSMTPPSDNELPKGPSIQSPKEETFKIHQPPFLSGEGEDAYFIGSSSGRALIDAFKRKLSESGNPLGSLDTAAFFAPYERSRSWLVTGSQSTDVATAPPRLLSDQLINVFFQEWAPLFPILHRPTFLSQYEQYVSNTSNITDRRVLTQLNLVFGIASLSQTGQLRSSVEQYEKRWHASMENCYLETSLASLQCLILALVHAMLSANPTKLLHFRSRAVGMSQRLGLHLSQKRFPLGALTTETRKRIFWTLYTLDCFAAASFGLPRLIKEADVECEYPVDADDEFVTEEGFMPTIPGSCTKLSSALALFRCSRVLARVLEENYPANASYELSLSKVAALDAELEAWQETLAPHLRMEFVADKPSTNVVSSRSPLLALTYHYIRTLIHRPAACGPLGEKASASVVALASSSKRIVQLVQLLDERRLNFSHCMNKDEILMVSGIGLLFQAMDLERDGKFMKDITRMVYTVADMLDRRHAPGAKQFRVVSSSILPKLSSPIPIESSRSPSSSASSSARDVSVQTQRQLQALAAKNSVPNTYHNQQVIAPQEVQQRLSRSPQLERKKQQSKSTIPAIATSNTKTSPPFLSSRSASESNTKAVLKQALQQIAPAPAPRNTNLDFLPLYSAADHRHVPPPPPSTTPGPDRRNEISVWDSIIESMNGRKTEIPDYYDSSAMGEAYQTQGAYLQAPSVVHAAATSFQPDMWAYNIEHMNLSPHVDHNSLVLSEESLTSTESLYSVDASSNDTTSEAAAFSGLMAPPPHLHHDHAYNLLDPLDSQILGGGVQYW